MRSSGFNEADVVADFSLALTAAGLRVQGDPIMDGQWHRAAADGDRGKQRSARYRGYLEGIRPAGFIENFRDTTRTGTWKFNGALPVMSDAERAAAKRKAAVDQAARDRAKAAKAEAIAEHGTAAWEAASPAPADHPYLVRKGIPGDGLRLNDAGWLLVPMYDLGGRLRSLQRIAPDGRKLFPSGAALDGLHLLLGEITSNGPLLIAEGLATARTLREATGYAVAVAFSKVNFGCIAQAYRKRHPKLPVWFCGDNDHHLPRRTPPLPNVGKEAAEAAARKVRGVAILPEFTEDQAGSDWNDYAALHGLEATRAAVHAALPPPPKPYFPAPTLTREQAGTVLRQEINRFIADAARTTAVRREWKKLQEEIDELHEPGTRERRTALRQARKAMAAKFGIGWQADGRRVLAPGAAGSGKTAITAEAIRLTAETLGHVFFATDTVENAEAVAERIPGAMVLRGRGRPDPMDAEGRMMCWRPEAAEKVARANLPVSQTLCDNGEGKRCAFIEQCGWQREARRMREGERGVYVGSHEYLTLNGPMPRPDVVIIDENCLAALVDQLGFGLDRVSPDAMPNWQRAGPAKALEHREIMSKVSEAIRFPAGILAGLRERNIVGRDGLKPAIEYLRRVEDQDFTSGLSPDMDDNEILEKLGQHERSEISSVLKMLTALSAEIELPRDQAHGVSFVADHPVMVDGRRERQARVFTHYRKRLSFKAEVPVLILDASGDAAVYQRLFGERLETVDQVRCDRHAHVVQIYDATFVQGTLIGMDRKGQPLSPESVEKAARTRAQIASVANALAAKHSSLLLAVNKQVEALITPELEETVSVGHFGNLRGSNLFEHCQAGLIVGRMEPPAWAMENIARALHAEDPEPLRLTGEYVKVPRGIRMRDGSAVMIETNTHADPRIQRVLELHRERDSEQAADRLRLIHNPEPKTLYIACNLPLDLTVDRLVSWRDLVREATGQADNGRQGTGRRLYADRLIEAWTRTGGVLPLSHRELVRLFPDLWGSERSARDDLERVRTRQLDIPIAESALFRPVVVRYRLQGQRCPSRALMGRPEPAGRAALEALVGPVVAYEVEGPHEPQPPPEPPRPDRAEGMPEASDMPGGGEVADDLPQGPPGSFPDSPAGTWAIPPGLVASWRPSNERAWPAEDDAADHDAERWEGPRPGPDLPPPTRIGVPAK